MDETELRAHQALLHMGYSEANIVYEPEKNQPPDFLVEGKFAVEVRRLNQSYSDEHGSQDLERISTPLWNNLRDLVNSHSSAADGPCWNRVLTPLLIDCGVVNGLGKPKFGIHALRHAAASLMIDQGILPKKIQTILGHSSITMTFDTYGHLFHDAESDREMMAKLEEGVMAA